MFHVGEIVRLEGLIASPSLNRAIGTLVGDTDFESRGKHTVYLQSPATAVAAHPSGLNLNPFFFQSFFLLKIFLIFFEFISLVYS